MKQLNSFDGRLLTEALGLYTREELRDWARKLGVERGQNKSDTIRNLLASGKLAVNFSVSLEART